MSVVYFFFTFMNYLFTKTYFEMKKLMITLSLLFLFMAANTLSAQTEINTSKSQKATKAVKVDVHKSSTACNSGCSKTCCAAKKSCKPGCSKTCCAKSKRSCKPGCSKTCCAKSKKSCKTKCTKSCCEKKVKSKAKEE